MTADREEILRKFEQITVWSRGSQRAPHKPLLLLYALGRWQRGDRIAISFKDVNRDLRELLLRFGPPRQSSHQEYPFWRLQNDGLWTVRADGPVQPARGENEKKSDFLKYNARGSFIPPIESAFDADPTLVGEIAHRLLVGHFPESVHADILEAVGLSIEAPGQLARPRDPGFRTRVLTAYEYRCAICGYDVRLGTNLLGIDAAHIQWHQAGGPDVESNALALCVLHHKSFDLGAFTVRPDLILLVSEQINGSCRVEETLLRHHAQSIREPQHPEHKPMRQYLDWHMKEVFKGAARHVK